MSRRFSTILLVLVSFAAGLAARESHVASRLKRSPRRRHRAGPLSRRPWPSRHPAGDTHRFQSHRRAHHPGRRQHLVAASRAPAGAVDPFFSQFFGDPDDDLRLAPRGREQPRLRGHRQQRRLHPHEQPRRHWRGTSRDDRAARRHGRARGQARDARRCRGRGSGDRPRRAEDRRARIFRRSRGETRRS